MAGCRDDLWPVHFCLFLNTDNQSERETGVDDVFDVVHCADNLYPDPLVFGIVCQCRGNGSGRSRLVDSLFPRLGEEKITRPQQTAGLLSVVWRVCCYGV